MAKVGDTVRYLNAVGGGVITKIDGRMAFVEEDGFENPVLISDIVVTMPAGHKNEKTPGARLMFDQQAFDNGKKTEQLSKVIETPKPEPAPLPPAEETTHGNKLNVVLAFEPADPKRLSDTSFNAVVVNDSNYYILFTLARRKDTERGWTIVYQDEVAPNELIDVAQLSHANLLDFERIAFQCVAYKKDKDYELKAPVSISRRLDLAKFHKLHCFRPGMYFDTPVLEIPLISDDVAIKSLDLQICGDSSAKASSADNSNIRTQLESKYRVDSNHKKKKSNDGSDNPHKLLPLIEVDLHIGELTDTIAGLEAKDMLEMQLNEVRKTMQNNRKRIGQKIVFIHGKGNGVLRKEMIALLKKEYPNVEIQDASFREYGFGASLVTIKTPLNK